MALLGVACYDAVYEPLRRLPRIDAGMHRDLQREDDVLDHSSGALARYTPLGYPGKGGCTASAGAKGVSGRLAGPA
jgi:hypothetical protein